MARWQIVLEVIRTLSALAIPIVIAFLGYKLNRRVKELEASQWRNQELIKARLSYYQSLAPRLNDLLCYFTFIGKWKELTPTEVIALRREIDRDFYSALPLFSPESGEAYARFMDAGFEIFGAWGTDARLRTGFVRRRAVFGARWQPEWEVMFTHKEDEGVTTKELSGFKKAYDKLLGTLAQDIELLAPRDRYATEEVLYNAS